MRSLISVEHPELGNSKDWVAVARDYAETRFPDWHPQMIAEFASDIDWRMEGIAISEASMEDAFEDWISGQSPYSPHTVYKEGYDYEIWALMQRAESLDKVRKVAMEAFSDEPWDIERFIAGYMDKLTASYTYERDILDAIKKYRAGEVVYSPHWIPMTEEGLENRKEREQYLRSQHSKSEDSVDKFFMDLWYYSNHGYGPMGPPVDYYKR